MPCDQAKEFLRRHDIAFEEIRIENFDDPMAELRAVTGGPAATPTIVVNGEVIVGFDGDCLREQLGID